MPELPKSSTSGGSRNPPTPTPWTRHSPSPCARDVGAQSAHGFGRVEHVIGFEQAGDLRLAHGQGAQDERPVRHGFVAGRGHRALERAALAGGERGKLGCGIHAERPKFEPLPAKSGPIGGLPKAMRGTGEARFDRPARSWQTHAPLVPFCRKHHLGQTRPRNQARLPQLRRPFLRSAEAADRMSQMRLHLRARGAVEAAPHAACPSPRPSRYPSPSSRTKRPRSSRTRRWRKRRPKPLTRRSRKPRKRSRWSKKRRSRPKTPRAKTASRRRPTTPAESEDDFEDEIEDDDEEEDDTLLEEVEEDEDDVSGIIDADIEKDEP